jgi:hypothetical protein
VLPDLYELGFQKQTPLINQSSAPNFSQKVISDLLITAPTTVLSTRPTIHPIRFSMPATPHQHLASVCVMSPSDTAMLPGPVKYSYFRRSSPSHSAGLRNSITPLLVVAIYDLCQYQSPRRRRDREQCASASTSIQPSLRLQSHSRSRLIGCDRFRTPGLGLGLRPRISRSHNEKRGRAPGGQ